MLVAVVSQALDTPIPWYHCALTDNTPVPQHSCFLVPQTQAPDLTGMSPRPPWHPATLASVGLTIRPMARLHPQHLPGLF